jgi:hypothetical protein
MIFDQRGWKGGIFSVEEETLTESQSVKERKEEKRGW